MKRKLLLILVALLPMLANAYTAEINGIYYNFSGNEATVTYKNTSYNSYSGAVIIPESITYNGNIYSVTSIGNSAFYGCKSLTSVTIPNSVTSIEDQAFYYCPGLTSVTIPNSVISIGTYAFSGCSLTSITIPESVISIRARAFEKCDGLSTVTLKSNSFTSISRTSDTSMKSIFGNQVRKYILGGDVETIGDKAFYDCSGLIYITIPNSLTSIGSSAFWMCKNLKRVIVPDIAAWCGISFNDGYANPLTYTHHLYSSDSIEVTNLVIPNGVTTIGNYAFLNCESLTSITIPNSVTSIGGSAFQNCI